MTRCTICHTLIQEQEPSRECPECRQEYHDSCWEELGGCATYGCEQAVPAQKPPPPSEEAFGGWGDTKVCPKCNREIGASMLVCRCRAKFPHANPMTKEEYREWHRGVKKLKNTRRTLVIFLILSLLGIPAPIFGTLSGVIAFRNRYALAGVDGTYLAMGYGSAALGSVYTLMILLLLAGL